MALRGGHKSRPGRSCGCILKVERRTDIAKASFLPAGSQVHRAERRERREPRAGRDLGEERVRRVAPGRADPVAEAAAGLVVRGFSR